MEPRYAALAADLNNELDQLDQLLEEMTLVQQRLPDPPTTLELRALGSILHDFYNRAERIFERIATVIDSSLPSGPNWDVELLSRMTYPIPNVRPAIISDSLRQRLSDNLRLRHLFRNIYGRELRWDLLRPLVTDLPDVHRDLLVEVQAFEGFLLTLGH